MSVKQTAPSGDSAMARHAASMVFPIGAPNDGFAQYFTGRSFLAPVSAEQVGIFNVTFEPGCRNNWHIHHAKSGGGQILICVAGRGFYQEWGRAAVERAGGARRVRRKKHFSVCKPFGTKKSGPFGAPSVRKVPQGGSCISIKFVSLKRCNPCGYAVFSLLRSARWCWKASSISSGVSSWRMPTPL